MRWTVKLAPSAIRELERLSDSAKCEADALLLELEESPIELADTELEGYVHLYAARFYRGRYRMIYRVSEKQRRVIVTRVRPRESAYEGMEPYQPER